VPSSEPDLTATEFFSRKNSRAEVNVRRERYIPGLNLRLHLQLLLLRRHLALNQLHELFHLLGCYEDVHGISKAYPYRGTTYVHQCGQKYVVSTGDDGGDL